MDFFAHTENSNGSWHKLADHLRGVGQLAAEFAAQMNPELIEAARWAGLLHDLGKYRDEFQEYLRGNRKGDIDTHHAVYGAALSFHNQWLGPAFAIAGHHAGLHDVSQLQQLVESPSYQARSRLPEIVQCFEREVRAVECKLAEPRFVTNNEHRSEFYVRMLFSALVDADFLDTEAHYTCEARTRRTSSRTTFCRSLLPRRTPNHQTANSTGSATRFSRNVSLRRNCRKDSSH